MMNIKLVRPCIKFPLCLLLFFTTMVLAQPSSQPNSQPSSQIKSQAKVIAKWEVLDIPVKLDQDIQKPFQRTANAIFTHASGKTKKVPIFYNGDKQWLIRFSASKTGSWQYQTQSDVSSLNGLTGKVTVEEAQADNHGAIVLNKDYPQHFFYEDGTPYYAMAFELDWLFALDYQNDKGVPKTDHMLSLIKDNGFNQVVMTVYSYDVRAESEPLYWRKDPKLANHPEHEFGSPKDIFPFLGTNQKPDFSALNVEFFKKFDRTIQSLHDKRIAAHLMIYVWNKLVSWPAPNSEADNMYLDYVIKRYQAYPNIIWDIAKEGLFYDRDEDYIKSRFERVNKLNYADRMLTIHDYGFCNRNPELVDFISIQDWKWNIYSNTAKAVQKFKNKPVFNIEHGGYDESPYRVFTGDYTDPEVNLRRNWHIIFAGAYSTYYWQAAAWNVIIYNPFQQDESFIKPKFNYYQNIAKFFAEYPFHNFVSKPEKYGSAFGLESLDGDTHAIYVHKDIFQTGKGRRLFKPQDGNKYQTQWFNTLTGEFTPLKIVEAEEQFISPWRGNADAVLVGTKLK
ncbi:MAG: DUF5060 domain-containing protein [Paraglaciecola sp.]